VKVEYDRKAWSALKRKNSFGVVDEKRYIISARRENGRPHCMKCDHPLEDRSKFKLVVMNEFVERVWVPRKAKPYPKTWVCVVCDPWKGQVIAVGISPKVVR
jgi:hypothetical protein